MQQARQQSIGVADDREWITAMPLYLASCVVTLAGVGAVGVTISEPAWTPLWATLTVIGHVVSLLLRRMRVSAEPLFYPVMLLGGALVVQQAVLGSPLVGLQTGLVGQSIDMATGLIVAMLAVLRTFTLVTNTALLFSPVPPITMLALVGSSNPNAEVPLFFGLSVLSSLFITGYEAHLRRMARVGRPPGPVTFHLFAAWAFTLVVAATAVIFPFIVQPILMEFSPFALPTVSRLQMMQNFTQSNPNQASVGQGPITLSPLPVYEVYTTESGKVRTAVFSRYTGRDWRLERDAVMADLTSREQVYKRPPGIEGMTYELHHFEIPKAPVPESRIVRQTFVTQARGQTAIPASGEITELWYPSRRSFRHSTGCMTGNAHQSAGRVLEVASEVRQFTPEELRTAPPVNPEDLTSPETMELPNSTLEVKQLAQEVTRSEPTPYDKVMAIIRHIENNCSYTLQEEVTPPGVDAAAHYLFKSKRGACDLAATATAVMCRGVGIPARVAVGYVLEEPLPQGGGFLVRQAHAHMWVEAFFPKFGWVPFDPAPPISSIKENPLTTAWYRMTTAFSKIGGGGLDAVLLVVVVLTTLGMAVYGGVSWLRLRILEPAKLRRSIAARPGGLVLLTYSQALRLLAARGWRREGWMTAREFLASLRQPWREVPEALTALERLTELFEQAEYSALPEQNVDAAANDALMVLTRLAPRAPRHRDEKRGALSSAEGKA